MFTVSQFFADHLLSAYTVTRRSIRAGLSGGGVDTEKRSLAVLTFTIGAYLASFCCGRFRLWLRFLIAVRALSRTVGGQLQQRGRRVFNREISLCLRQQSLAG